MATASSLSVVPKIGGDNSTPGAVVAPLPKPVIFATSGLGGMLGWAIVHPANTIAGEFTLLHSLT